MIFGYIIKVDISCFTSELWLTWRSFFGMWLCVLILVNCNVRVASVPFFPLQATKKSVDGWAWYCRWGISSSLIGDMKAVSKGKSACLLGAKSFQIRWAAKTWYFSFDRTSRLRLQCSYRDLDYLWIITIDFRISIGFIEHMFKYLNVVDQKV